MICLVHAIGPGPLNDLLKLPLCQGTWTLQDLPHRVDPVLAGLKIDCARYDANHA